MTTDPKPSPSAAKLREAADLIRNIAKAADSAGEWDHAGHVPNNEAAVHVDLWDPAMALGVAAWLDVTAEDMEINQGIPARGWLEALTIARLIKGSTS